LTDQASAANIETTALLLHSPWKEYDFMGTQEIMASARIADQLINKNESNPSRARKK
jgi:hypothetical protein